MNTLQEKEIIENALLKLKHITDIKFDWHFADPNEYTGTDAILKLKLGDEIKIFHVIIKKNIRKIHLPDLYALANIKDNLMVVTDILYPAIIENFKQWNIACIDTAGNAYIKTNKNFILVEGKKLNVVHGDGDIFTPAVIKFVFYLLDDDNFRYFTYRQMADVAGTALGNINKIINKLTNKQYIVKLNEKIKLINVEDLFNNWAEAYGNILKPKLLIGKFRFLQNIDWNNFIFEHDTVWGGEPAANIITNYLKAAEFTIYTRETKIDFIKNWKLIPDEIGNVNVYDKFWKDNYDVYHEQKLAPYLITYADLVNTGNSRNIETAKMIYDQYIKTKLK